MATSSLLAAIRENLDNANLSRYPGTGESLQKPSLSERKLQHITEGKQYKLGHIGEGNRTMVSTAPLLRPHSIRLNQLTGSKCLASPAVQDAGREPTSLCQNQSTQAGHPCPQGGRSGKSQVKLSKGVKGRHFLLTALSTSAGNLIFDLEKLILGSPQGLQPSLTPASPCLPPLPWQWLLAHALCVVVRALLVNSRRNAARKQTGCGQRRTGAIALSTANKRGFSSSQPGELQSWRTHKSIQILSQEGARRVQQVCPQEIRESIRCNRTNKQYIPPEYN